MNEETSADVGTTWQSEAQSGSKRRRKGRHWVPWLLAAVVVVVVVVADRYLLQSKHQ